eukprot:GHRR01030362.1.p1 GENE.GHRR01030362.1~~GHRR01030362.1.p1  ORF type:complete len:120 (+),score=8.60 GHRR01030362.1:926-1285(+)
MHWLQLPALTPGCLWLYLDIINQSITMDGPILCYTPLLQFTYLAIYHAHIHHVPIHVRSLLLKHSAVSNTSPPITLLHNAFCSTRGTFLPADFSRLHAATTCWQVIDLIQYGPNLCLLL